MTNIYPNVTDRQTHRLTDRQTDDILRHNRALASCGKKSLGIDWSLACTTESIVHWQRKFRTHRVLIINFYSLNIIDGRVSSRISVRIYCMQYLIFHHSELINNFAVTLQLGDILRHFWGPVEKVWPYGFFSRSYCYTVWSAIGIMISSVCLYIRLSIKVGTACS